MLPTEEDIRVCSESEVDAALVEIHEVSEGISAELKGLLWSEAAVRPWAATVHILGSESSTSCRQMNAESERHWERLLLGESGEAGRECKCLASGFILVFSSARCENAVV